MTRGRVLASAAAGVMIAASALAQFGGPRGPFHERLNIPYDGQFTFVRLKYTTAPGGYWYGGWPAWGHGYPISEQNLMNIINEVNVSQFWEWSGTGLRPIDDTNEAYKLGVNYIIYGMTH